MKKLLGAISALATLALCSPPAYAWWDMGHMTVAAIAYERLSPAARARAAELLRLNPDYEKWTRGVPAEERDRAAFVHAATWADDIKRSRNYQRSSIAQDGADAAANIGYADHLVHDYWHYVDLPYSLDGALTDAYRADAERTARQQVALAGARLAELINAALR